jgi:hypothetical protein
MFTQINRVSENGLLLLSGMLNGVGDKVDLNKIGDYIIVSIKSPQDDIVRLGIGLVSDIANAYGEQIQRFLADFVAPILDVLKSGKSDISSKKQAIIAIGDLAMQGGDLFSQ